MKNRTVIGIICIIAALAVCFGIAPLVNKISDEKTEIVRITQTVLKGSQITEDDIEVVSVGSYNLPDNVIREKAEVVGMYAVCDLYEGEYLLPSKLTQEQTSASGILESLDDSELAISVSISSFAAGLSGKLQTGDIVSLIVYSSKDGTAFTPPELQYVMVITTTTSQGVDKEDVTDSSQPSTVTLLVNREQAECLAQYDKTASIYFSLAYRGDLQYAQKFLDEQEEYFSGGVSADE
jgi:pilus assembly protein CpaB